MFSRDDIMKAIIEGHLKIYPFRKEDLTGIGYNLSTTNFAFSINKGILLTVHQRTTSNGLERYVIIPKNDTVLFFSKEYIAVDNTIAGTFHSKVARVCQGLGHVSTTLDPTWKGQLIISVNNPTSESVIFDLDKKSGNVLTMLLHKLDTPVTGSDIHDNNRGRCDLLLEHFIPISNKKYRKKHLELKEFIVTEFADSLNGYDSFLKNSQFEDKYSKKVLNLTELKKRFETDSLLLNEARYTLGENGEYHIFRNKEEKQLMKGCIIFKIDKEMDKIDCIFKDIKSDISKILEVINKCIYAIDYELEMIDHIRRIDWQNTKINHFASEESDIVKERRYEDRKNALVKNLIICIGVFVYTLIFVAIIMIVTGFKKESIIMAVIPSCFTSVLAFIVQCWKKWEKRKE